MKAVISFRKPLSLFAIAFLTSPLFQSCKEAPAEGNAPAESNAPVERKAPAEGEIFITLKSDEVRPLADTKITFFGSDFAEEFETFRNNLFAEAKDDLKTKLNQKISDGQKKLESLEESRTSIVETARDTQNEALQNLRTTLSKKVAEYNDVIQESTPLVQTLDEKFLKYSQSETALVQKANTIEAEAHSLSVALILKVNKAIVSEGIAVPKYEENHQNPKQS